MAKIINLYGCDYRVLSQNESEVKLQHIGEVDGYCGYMCAPTQTLTPKQLEDSKKEFPACRPTE